MYKAYMENNAAAFARAVAHRPHIISCSWEAPQYDPVLHLAVHHAVAEGIVVFFACGNEGSVAWPGCERAVLSVGGVYIDGQGHLEASNYASSGIRPDVPGRQVPDFCGIDGLAPHGRLIALPTQPGCEADVKGSVNGRDGTAPHDGWVVESGTSGATPMVAAAAALVMQIDLRAWGDADAVRACLASSCVDVVRGRSASGQEAGPGVDPATGAGLVQAYAAIGAAEARQRRRHSSEGGTGTMPAKGGEVRAWLFMRVDDPNAAAKERTASSCSSNGTTTGLSNASIRSTTSGARSSGSSPPRRMGSTC
jgi:serine protease AprX